MSELPRVAVVMAFAGSDSTGGAGIQADIEAIASMGCHAAPVITAVTVQDTTNVFAFTPQDSELVVQQARAVLEDVSVAAFKIGFLCSVEIINAVHILLTDYPEIPVVLDPIVKAGGWTIAYRSRHDRCDTDIALTPNYRVDAQQPRSSNTCTRSGYDRCLRNVYP